MTYKKIIGKLHLWLGLMSGLVVFIVGLTGCIYVFEKEIRYFTEPYQFVMIQNRPFLQPSLLQRIAEKQLEGKKANQIQFEGKGKAAIVAQYNQNSYWLVYLNPYSGEVLKIKNMKHDFFRIIITGHYCLWIPIVGEYLVAWGTLIFVILLLSGLILWWPKRWNHSARRGALTINWRSRFTKLNYDLHNVLGFYALLFSLAIALTGMVWGFQWFSKSSYWLTSGGKQLPGWEIPVSDTTKNQTSGSDFAVDKVWRIIYPQYTSKPGIIGIEFPHTKTDVVTVNYNPEAGTYYKTEARYFDQFSTKELQGKALFAEQYKKSSTAKKLRRMNYDIHTGAIWGLTGKLLAFFASLITASLPITGLYIWLGKRK